MTLKDKMSNSVVSSKRERGSGWIKKKKTQGSSRFFILFLEREPLLSSFSENPIVDSFKDKKESCSTRRGFHVGTRFEEF